MTAAGTDLRPTPEAFRHACRLNLLASLMPGELHEVNQPLAGIVNYTFGCRLRLERAGQEFADLVEALKQVEVLKGQVADKMIRLRDWVNWRTPNAIPVTITEDWVANALAPVRPALHRQAIQLQMHIPAPSAVVRIDPIQLQELFLHLFRNSLDAMAQTPPTERAMDVRIDVESGMAEITVRDSGPGISREVLPKLFTPFCTTKPLGLGMGLALCREILQAHGGDIRHRADGQAGTAMILTLPLLHED